MVKKNGKIGLRGKKCEKPCSVFGLRPSVSFCSASAKNFHFGASLNVMQAKNIFLYFPFLFLLVKNIVNAFLQFLLDEI